MSHAMLPALTPAQQEAQRVRRATLTKLLDTLDEIREALLVHPGEVSQLRRLANTSNHLRDMLRINREALPK